MLENTFCQNILENQSLFLSSYEKKIPNIISLQCILVQLHLCSTKRNFIYVNSNSGPPWYIFGRQGCHNGSHFNSAPPVFSISQNPTKDQALATMAALPPLVALEKTHNLNE